MDKHRKSLWMRWLFISSLLTSLIAPYLSNVALAQASPSPSAPQELPAFENHYTQVFRNPDGTISSKIYFAPVNYTGQDGNLHHIDTTLTPNPSRGYKVDKNRFVTQFGASSDSPSLETVTYKGKDISFELAPTSRAGSLGAQTFSKLQHAIPSTDHSTITYNSVYPDVNLKEEVTSLGVKETLVLNKYQPGLHSFAFVLNTNGVTPQIEKDSSVNFLDSSGNVVFSMPPGLMQDSNVDPHSGDAQQSNAVTYQLKTVGTKTVLVVSVDEN